MKKFAKNMVFRCFVNLVNLIFLGSDFARTVDTKFIRVMGRPWSKLTERWENEVICIINWKTLKKWPMFIALSPLQYCFQSHCLSEKIFSLNLLIIFLFTLCFLVELYFPQLKMRICSLDEEESQKGDLDGPVQVSYWKNLVCVSGFTEAVL